MNYYATWACALAGSGIFAYGIVRQLRHRQRLPRRVERVGEALVALTWLLWLAGRL